MKLKLVLGGVSIFLVAIAIFIPVVNEAQSRKAAEDVLADYKQCEQGYELLGKEEEAAKSIGAKDEPKWLKGHLEILRSVENSCSNYHKYWKKWGSAKLPPSDGLFWALISRYEPERLKQE